MELKHYKMEDALESLIDYRGKTPQKSDEGIPTLSAKSVKNGYIDYSECYYISPEEYKRFMVRGFPKVGDILLTTEAPMGMVARLDRDDVGIAQRLITLRGKEGILDNNYLMYYLQSAIGQHKLAERESGSTVTGIKQAEFRKIEIDVPDIEIQRKIASCLNCIDSKIETNKKINRNLSEQAQALYKSWFIDFEPYGGDMPENWKEGTLGDLAEIRTDAFRPDKNPDVIVEHYSIPALDEKNYPVFEEAAGIKSNKYFVTKADVMFSKLNPDTKRIWRPYCLSEYPVCSTEFMVYRAFKPENKDFVYSIIDSAPFLQHVCAHTSGSTNSRQRAIPATTLNFVVIIPTNDVIKDFCGMVTPLYELIEKNIIENQKLAETRDRILPKLMSGELDVSDLEI